MIIVESKLRDYEEELAKITLPLSTVTLKENNEVLHTDLKSKARNDIGRSANKEESDERKETWKQICGTDFLFFTDFAPIKDFIAILENCLTNNQIFDKLEEKNRAENLKESEKYFNVLYDTCKTQLAEDRDFLSFMSMLLCKMDEKPERLDATIWDSVKANFKEKVSIPTTCRLQDNNFIA